MAARRRFWVIGGAGLALAVLTLGVLHSRPVRARALAALMARLEQAGTVARIGRFDYNLLTLTADLYDVTLANPSSQPFFSAKEIHAALGWNIFSGRVDVKNVEVVSPRFVLVGSSSASSKASPIPIRIRHARVNNLVVVWQDAQAASSLEAGVSFELTSDGRAASGPVTMTAPIRFRWRDHVTTVAALGGRVSWNDRDLALQALSLRVPEGTLTADGRVDALLGDPRVDLQVVADANLQALSPWLNLDRPIAGTAHATAHVTGDAVELTGFRAQVAGGTITARGQTSLGGSGAARLDWEQLDLQTLLRTVLEHTPQMVPASRINGSLDARWTAPQLDRLQLTANSHALGGDLALELRGQQWKLSARDIAAQGAHASATLDGTLNVRDLPRSSVGGSVQVRAQDVGEWLRNGPPIHGTAAGDFMVSGTLGAPALDGSADASVQYQSLKPATVRTHASVTLDEIRLSELDARLADSFARGEVRWSIRSDRIEGSLNGSVSPKDFGLPIDVNGSLDLATVLSGSLAKPHAAIAGTGAALDISGQHIDRLSAEVRVDGALVTVDRLHLERGDGRLDAHGAVDLTRETYAAHAVATDVQVSDADTQMSARLNGRFDGEGSFQNLGGQGRVAVDHAQWQSGDLGRIDADFTLAGRDASVEIDARDLALKGSGTVGVDPNGPLSLRGQWQPDDVAAIAQRFAIAIPFSAGGSAALRFELTGTRDHLDALRGRASVDRVDVSVAGQPFRLARSGQLEYDGRTLRVDNIALTTGTSTLTIEGSVGESVARGLTVALDGSLTDFAFVRDLIQPRTTGESALPSPTGSVHLRLTADGALAQPRIAGTLQIAEGRVPFTDRDSLTDVGVSARYDDGVLIVERAAAAFQGATLAASGRLPSNVFLDRLPASVRERIKPASGPATLSAQIRSITPSVAAPFVDAGTLTQITGGADASIQLEADRPVLDRVRGTIALDRAELSLAGVSFNQQTTTRLVVRDGRVTVDTWNWAGDNNRVALRGSATLGDNPALDLVATSALDLRVLNIFTPTARIAGRADAEIRLAGTARSPTLEGYVTLNSGEARVADPRLVVGDVTGTITFTGDTLTLERVFATVNGGDAELAGSIRHRWLTPLDGHVTLRTSNAALDIEGLRAEADANLAVTLDAGGAVVGGTVTLLRSAFHEPLSLTGGLLRALQASSRATPPNANSPLGRTRLDVRVATQDDLIVDNNYAKVAVSGDLRLVGTVSRPSVTGRATLAEGGMIFFGGNRYRLDKQGSIDFANPNQIEPDLDLSAVTRVGETDITLELKGTPATLHPALRSETEPDLSEGELVSRLVTGRSSADLAAAGGFAPGRELIGYLSGDLLGAAGRAVGLDTVRLERGTPDVRFDAGLVAAETNPGARLTFGKNVGSKAEVVFSQSLQQSGGLTWIVSYAPRSGINLRAVSLDDGDRLYDFRHDVTFGGGARPVRAAKPSEPTVSDVTITGAGSDAADVRSRLKLGPGDRFSFFRWQDDRERIENAYHERGRFEARVVTRRMTDSADPARVRLAYDVRPGPRTTIVADGFSFSGAARQQMERAWTRAVVDDFLTEEVASLARAELADAGFVLPSVVATVEGSADDKRLHITVDPGQHTSARRVEFIGNRRESSNRLLAALSARDLARAVWVEPDRARDALVDFYRANGYLNAKVRVDPISMTGDTATRPVHVDEGDAFRLRDVRIDGARAVSMDEARRIAALSSGDMFTESAIERARVALDGLYRARGYNSVGITLQTETVPNSAAAGAVDVAIRVDEGPQQRLRDIVTEGLGRTSPALVSRALKLDLGEPVNLVAWNTARRRLYETGAFRSVDIQREVIGPAETEEPIRAKVTVQEWPRLRARYGLEVRDAAHSAGDAARSFLSGSEGGGARFGVGVTGDLSARNLFGRAVSAGLAGRYSANSRAGRAYATAPSFFGLPITSNVFVERSREELGATTTSEIQSGLPAFRVEKTDLTIEQRLRPFSNTELGYRYMLERNHTFDVDPDPTNPLPFDIAATTAKVASTIAVDTRNDLVDTTRGWFHASDFEYAAAALGSELRFVKYLFQQRYFRSRGRVVFASSARVGLAAGFGQTLIPSERFFAGGGNSVRGYDEDVLSPIDTFGDTVGGNALVVLNQEVRFPIFKIVRGVTFVDAGRAFDEVGHVALRGLATSTGFGLRVQTPVVLVRVDVGVPFDARIGPRRPGFFLSIGQMF